MLGYKLSVKTLFLRRIELAVPRRIYCLRIISLRSSLIPIQLCLAGVLFISLTVLAETKVGNDRAFKQEKCSHFQLCGVTTALSDDGIHDPSNDAIKVLQPPSAAMTGFPRTDGGIIDWVQVLEQGIIEPRTGITGTEKMYSVDFDVIFKNTASMPFVKFPHKQHTMWLTCANCHPKIFLPERGKNHVTMAGIMSGKYCGVCHGKVAFPPLECPRCHKVPRAATGLR